MTEKRLKELFDKHHRALLFHAYKIVKDVDACEDIVQESFIKFYYRSGEVPNDEQFFYLMGVVKNGCADWLKKERRIINKHIEANSPAADYQSHRDSNILKAIETLPEARRIVLKMRIVDGYEYEEIAQLLKISIYTVRTQVHRAMIHLNKYLHSGEVMQIPKKSKEYYHPGITGKTPSIIRSIIEGADYKEVMSKFKISAPTYYKYKKLAFPK